MAKLLNFYIYSTFDLASGLFLTPYSSIRLFSIFYLFYYLEYVLTSSTYLISYISFINSYIFWTASLYLYDSTLFHFYIIVKWPNEDHFLSSYSSISSLVKVYNCSKSSDNFVFQGCANYSGAFYLFESSWFVWWAHF
jgi:hypothetical protein